MSITTNNIAANIFDALHSRLPREASDIATRSGYPIEVVTAILADAVSNGSVAERSRGFVSVASEILTPSPVIVGDDEENVYQAAHIAAERWNGFAIPYFTKAEALRFANDAAENGAPDAWIYDEARDLFVLIAMEEELENEDDDAPRYDEAFLDTPSERLYSLGGGGYTWMEAHDIPVGTVGTITLVGSETVTIEVVVTEGVNEADMLRVTATDLDFTKPTYRGAVHFVTVGGFTVSGEVA